MTAIVVDIPLFWGIYLLSGEPSIPTVHTSQYWEKSTVLDSRMDPSNAEYITFRHYLLSIIYYLLSGSFISRVCLITSPNIGPSPIGFASYRVVVLAKG